MEIYVLTEKKGSNPGGKVSFDLRGEGREDYYLKYCLGNQSRDPRFQSQHQPIYEAATMAWFERIGLRVPEFFVLENQGDISFDYASTRIPRLVGTIPFYFCSKLVDLPRREDETLLEERLRSEKIYRDCLGITDVSGKRQNFTYIRSVDSEEEYVLYLDLGCSFVHAVNGQLIPRSRKGKSLNKKERKTAERNLDNSSLSVPTGETFSMRQLYDLFFEVGIPTRRSDSGTLRNTPLERLLTSLELEAIAEILFEEFTETIRFYKKNPHPRFSLE